MRQLKIEKKITQRDTESLSKYMNEVSQFKDVGLSHEREVELARGIREAKTEDEKNRYVKELTSANLRFVISVAKQYQNYSKFFELNDLINSGNIGLIKAAERFDETRGFKFISYAVWWVRQSIMEDLSKYGDVIRKPSNKIGLHNKAKKVHELLEQKLGRTPTSEEIFFLLKEEKERHKTLTEKDVDEIFAINSAAFRMDAFVNETDSPTRFVDIMESGEKSAMEEFVEKNDRKVMINTALARLSDREELILKMNFGLEEAPLSLEEIAGRLNLTRERVRQIRETAIRRLRAQTDISTLKQYA